MMFKTIFFVFLVSGVFLSCSNSKSGNNSNQEKKQNFLFIVVDDLNTTLGCYGHPLVKTPNIDKLAESGLKFNHAYCNYAVCGPSRGSFLTGLRPETIGVLDNNTPLAPLLNGKTTMPHLFRMNGYHTMSLGKIFHRPNDHSDPKAWDEIYGYAPTELGKKGEKRNISDGVLRWCHWQAAEGDDDDQPDGQNAKKAVEFIKAKKDKPFFLAVGFHKPHDPFIAPKKYFDMYPLEDCDPPSLPENWEPVYKHSLPGETITFNKFTDQDKREFLRSYYACTSFMDAQVGKIIAALKESGQLENTLIVFMGDHGYHLGEHNWWNKVTIYEKGTNAPFIVFGNAVQSKGVETNAMFEFIDLYPTFADIFQLENIPDYLEGKSFAGILKQPNQPFRAEVRAVVNRGNMMGRMVKNENFRYIEWANGDKGRELYDQKNDPVEYNNLAEKAEFSAVVEEMKTLINQK